MNKYTGKDFVELVEQLSEHYDLTNREAIDAMYTEAYKYMEKDNDKS